MGIECCNKQQDTLCRDCQNCTRCSWADGIPVKGWTATKTVVRDYDGDFKSYLVTQCPLFKRDIKKKITIAEMAQILGKPHGTLMNILKTPAGRIYVRSWLRAKGYKLIINEIPLKNGGIRAEFIIKELSTEK